MFIEDFSTFFTDFAVPCTVGGVAMPAIFDAPGAQGNAGLLGMSTTAPALLVQTSLLAGDPVGQSVAVNSASYLVAAHEPDGSGLSRLLLEQA